VSTPFDGSDLWAKAATLRDLGVLTARALEGELVVPGVLEFDEETGPIASGLAALNRAGLVTIDSQPGVPMSEGYAQRAAVDGYCDAETYWKIESVTTMTELIVMGMEPGRSAHWQMPVTIGDDYLPSAWAGAFWHTRENADGAFVDAGEAARDAVAQSWYLQAIDPVWGRNDRLWPALLTVLDS
jgi:hypothetical protein